MSNREELEKLFSTMMQLGKLMEQRTQESQEERIATMLQYSALSNIHSEMNLTLTSLADTLKLSKSSTTQLVERLVQAGFVLRQIDQKDKRIIRLELTDKGKAEMTNLRKKFISTMNDAFSDIPKNDILELIRIHTDMIDSLRKKKYESN